MPSYLVRQVVQVTDAAGLTTTTGNRQTVEDVKTLADLITDGAALASAVDAVSSGKVTKGWVTVEYLPSEAGATIKLNPDAGSEIQQVATLNFHLTGSTYVEPFVIPAIADSKISSNRLNLSDAAVSALIAFLSNSGSAGDWVNAFGVVLTTVRDAFLSYWKSRRRKFHSLTWEN